MNESEVRQTIVELRAIVKRDLPRDEKLILQSVIESLEDYLKLPYDEDASPFTKKKHYGTIYKKRVGKV